MDFIKRFFDFFSLGRFGQGTIEYLVVIAVVVVISLVVVGLVTGFFSSGSSAVRVSDDVRSAVGSGGISVLEGVSDSNGDVVLRLKNSAGEGFSVSRISGLSGGVVVNKEFDNVFVPGGGDASFSLSNLSDVCKCNPGENRKVCEFEVTLTSQNGLEKKQRMSKSVDCVSNTAPSGIVLNSFGALWAQGPTIDTGTSGSNAQSVFVDSNNNVYLTGGFGTVNLGFGNGVTLTPNGASDFYVVKYNSSGVAQWAFNSVSNTGSVSVKNIFVDSGGNIFVAGNFSNTLGFGNGVTLTYRGISDFFVVKYDSNRVAQWAKNPGLGTGTGNDVTGDLFVDSNGNVYLTGTFQYSNGIGFGNDINVTARGGYDFFVVKFNSNGTALWARNPGLGTGTSTEWARSIFVDSLGNVYALGYFSSSTLGFGNDVNLTNRGSNDFYVVKYDFNGNALWATNPDVGTSDSVEIGESIFVDSSGNVYVSGQFGSATLGFGSGVSLTNRGTPGVNMDFFVVKYGSDGNALWAANPASGTATDNEYDTSVYADSGGNVFLFGRFKSATLGFGNGLTLTNRGSATHDFFVVKYDSSGSALWAQGPAVGTGPGHEGSWGAFIDSISNAYLCGSFDSNILGFGNNVILTHPSSGKFFVVKYGFR